MNIKEVFAWGMYDLANTIFSALFVTVFYPLYIVTFLGGTKTELALVFSLSMLAVGLIVPVIGAWSDKLGRRMPFLIVFTITCCILTAIVGKLSLLLALYAGFLANFCYHGALTTYNALLPKIAKNRELGSVSGIGTAMGYLGTLISLGVAGILLERNGWESIKGTQSVFIATAIMFFVFSLFTFFGIKEPIVKKKVRIRDAIGKVWETISHLSSHKKFMYFLGSMFCYANAINTIILFLAVYATEHIGLSLKAFFFVYVIQSLGAVIGSFASGKLVDRFGAKNVLMWAGFGWIGVILCLYFVVGLKSFIAAGTIGGALLGTVWTAQRPKLLNMVDKKHVGQFFGYLESTNKFSGIFGFILFGILADYASYKTAMLSLIVFFVIGLILLRKVPGD